MIGGIIGDVIGSVYEGRQWIKKDLLLIQKLPIDDNIVVPVIKNVEWCRRFYGWTDDTLCTLGLYNAYINKEDYAESLQSFCVKHLNEDTGFGSAFKKWLEDRKPYNSYANGSIMRIGFIPFLKELSLKQKLKLGYDMTKISHNHNDSYEAVELYITLCDTLIKSFSSKGEAYAKEGLRRLLVKHKFYKTVESMHKEKLFEINALKTLYQSIVIVYESRSYEEALRNCYYVGGDSDTLATIAGNIASLIYKIPPQANKIIDLSIRNQKNFQMLIGHFKNKYQ